MEISVTGLHQKNTQSNSAAFRVAKLFLIRPLRNLKQL